MKWSKPVKARRPAGFIQPCIPTAVIKVPEGPMWLHEIKHDGYRILARKSGDRVRLFTRRGYDWSDRYPRIVEAAKKIRGTFLIDGEAVVSDESGIADFERLHSRGHDKSATLWAFDLLELNGEDLRRLPLDERKARLAKLLKGSRRSGIALNEHLEDDGERAFWHACNLGFEGIVSKRRDSRYVSGRSKTWLMIKNPNALGVLRFRDSGQLSRDNGGVVAGQYPTSLPAFQMLVQDRLCFSEAVANRKNLVFGHVVPSLRNTISRARRRMAVTSNDPD